MGTINCKWLPLCLMALRFLASFYLVLEYLLDEMSSVLSSSGEPGIENRLLDTVGEGEGGTNGVSSVDTYTSLHEEWTASGNVLCDSARSAQCSVTT